MDSDFFHIHARKIHVRAKLFGGRDREMALIRFHVGALATGIQLRHGL